MTDLHGLYQEVILDHNKRPHNFRIMPDANCRADGFNRLCGDKVTIFVNMDGDRISDVSFQGSGCAISTASASILTDAVKGKTRA
jgi:nitrogen fixation NifU-like protein